MNRLFTSVHVGGDNASLSLWASQKSRRNILIL